MCVATGVELVVTQGGSAKSDLPLMRKAEGPRFVSNEAQERVRKKGYPGLDGKLIFKESRSVGSNKSTRFPSFLLSSLSSSSLTEDRASKRSVVFARSLFSTSYFFLGQKTTV